MLRLAPLVPLPSIFIIVPAKIHVPHLTMKTPQQINVSPVIHLAQIAMGQAKQIVSYAQTHPIF